MGRVHTVTVPAGRVTIADSTGGPWTFTVPAGAYYYSGAGDVIEVASLRVSWRTRLYRMLRRLIRREVTRG